MHSLLKLRNATRAGRGGLDTAAAEQVARSEVEQNLQHLALQMSQTEDPLALQADLAAIKTAWAQAGAGREGVDAQGRTVYGPVVQASIAMLRHIGDHSNLVLDPDLDSFYLINTLVLTMPRAVDELGQLWGWSSYGVAKGGLSYEEYRRYAVWDAGVLRGLEEMGEALRTAGAAHPGLLETLDLKPLEQAQRYREQVSDPARLVSAAHTPAEVFQLGANALQGFVSFYAQGLPTLDRLLAEREARLTRLGHWAQAALWVFLVVAAYLFYSFYLVTRGGLRLIGEHLNEMARGDLRRPPGKPWGRDEPALLILDLRQAYDALRELTEKVAQSAQELHIAASQISEASHDLSARTGSSAANLERQATVIQRISVAGQSSACSLQAAARMAEANAVASRQGSEVIASVVEVMAALQNSSRQIGQIVTVMDGIAFQTHLLALNASVEAARAGERGRGFAVVATEVQALARRSALAAREIRGLIAANVQRADQGETVVRQAGDSLQAIVEQVFRIHHLLQEVTGVVSLQASDIEQVGRAVHLLDQDTWKNAAMVEQTSATVTILKDQANALLAEVAGFKLR